MFIHFQEQQESARTAPNLNSAPSLDVFSSMLKDTTSQHRAHLFDLNCKICTGIYSADFVQSKRIVMLSMFFVYLFFQTISLLNGNQKLFK